MLRWLSLIGITIAEYLDDHGLPGSMHQETFDVWYPGYLDNIGNFRHTISFFTETALYRYATPHFYTVDEFPAVRQGLGTEMLYASPWKGGWWRLSDACRYMYGADMAVLDLSVKYREQMIYNKYRAARDTIEKFEKEPPFAYEIPREQHDAPTAAVLMEKLMLQGIEVHQSSNPDAWVILMNQPFAGLVKELFEPQVYPTITQRPYDVTGWTLPYQMGVEVHAVTTPPTKQFLDSLRSVKEITGLAAPFQLSANASYRAVNQILAAKGTVSLAGDDVAVSGLEKGRLDGILSENRLRAVEAKEGGKPVKPRRIGLYRPWVASIDEGWTRWILEQYQFPFANLYNADIVGGHLKEHYDAIVIPDIGGGADHQWPSAGHHSGALRRRPGRGGCRGAARFRQRGRHADRVQQRQHVRHQSIQAAGDQRAGGRVGGPVFLLGRAAEGAYRGPQESADRRPAARYDGDVRTRPGLRHPAGFQRRGAGAVQQGPIALRERLPVRPRPDRGQSGGAGRGVWEGACDPAGLQAAVARAIARVV